MFWTAILSAFVVNSYSVSLQTHNDKHIHTGIYTQIIFLHMFINVCVSLCLRVSLFVSLCGFLFVIMFVCVFVRLCNCSYFCVGVNMCTRLCTYPCLTANECMFCFWMNSFHLFSPFLYMWIFLHITFHVIKNRIKPYIKVNKKQINSLLRI